MLKLKKIKKTKEALFVRRKNSKNKQSVAISSLLFFAVRYYRQAFIVIILFSLILSSVFFYEPKNIQAATFSFTQNSWTDGYSSSLADHNSNQSGWSQFSTSTNIFASSTLQLPSVNYAFTDDGATSTIPAAATMGGGFWNGATSSTVVSGSGTSTSVGLAVVPPGFYKVVSGYSYSCGLKNDGSVYCWGFNSSGQLGDNTTVNKSVPVQVLGVGGIGTLANIVSIGAGEQHACAVSSAGSVYCWGYNSSGQLGDNTTVNKSVPVQVLGVGGAGTLASIADIGASRQHTCAVSSAGSVYCWGSNGFGQLGDNTTVYKTVPVQVLGVGGAGTLANIVNIDAGIYHTCAVSSAGSAYCWGDNGSGQLGDNTIVNKSVPVQVLGVGGAGTLASTTDIGAGGYYGDTCAVSSAGSAYCWGYNGSGQLGDNTTVSKSVPVQVLGVGGAGTLANIASISSAESYEHTCAVSSAGSAYCWGFNGYGELGDNTTNNKYTPVQVKGVGGAGTLANITDIGAGYSHTCAVSSAGSVYCWGDNGYGQLGDNTTVNKSVPVQVLGVGGTGTLNLNPLYYTSGTFTSATINTGVKSAFTTFSYAATLNSQTITMDVRAGNTATYDGTWTTLTNVANGGSISGLGGNRYIQYIAHFSTTNTIVTPTLDSVTINYSQYDLSGDLTSSKYDTSSVDNLIARLIWQASATSTDETIRFQIRSAISSSTLDSAPWCGYTEAATSTCAGTAYFDYTQNDVLLPADHPLQSGNDDRWFQYKTVFASGGAATPVLSEIKVRYVVNAMPEVQNVSASQIATSTDPNYGKIVVDYEVRDSDTYTGAASGTVTIDLEYCTADCGSTSTVWTTATSSALAGDFGAGVSVASTTWTAHQLVWDPQVDYDNQYNGANFKVRVKANDSEGANNNGYGESAIFTLDTKSPTPGSIPIKVSALTNPAIVTLSASDDFNKEFRLASTSEGIATASWETFSGATTTATSFNLVTDPDMVYVQFRDIYGNTTAVYSATTAETPVSGMIQDTSNVQPPPDISDFRLFVAWKKSTMGANFNSYHVERSTTTGATWEALCANQDINTNFCTDTNVSSSSVIWYRIYAKDQDDNVSYYSLTLTAKANGVQDFGEGGGGVEATPPVISNVAVISTTTQTATIEWDTDEPSNSTVGYSTAPGVFSSEIGVATIVNDQARLGRHRVVLTNLTPAVTYYFQTKSADVFGNLSTSTPNADGYTFATKPGPVISNTTVTETANTSATITWNTNIPGNSMVVYSTSPTMASTTEVYGSDNAVLTHQVTINNLSQGTKYYYYVKTRDADSNEAIDDNAGQYYYFTTANDTIPPTFSGLTAVSISDTSAVIAWTTNERATAKVEMGTASGIYSTSTPVNANYNINHAVSLTALTPLTKYYYRVISMDASGNTATSSELFFTTLNILSSEEQVKLREEAARQAGAGSVSGGGTLIIDKNDKVAPTITNISITNISTTTADVSWTTDETADSFVEYGLTENYESAIGQREAVTYHFVRLQKLEPNTAYHYRLTSSDANGNIANGDDQIFTTQGWDILVVTKDEITKKIEEIENNNNKTAQEKELAKTNLLEAAVKRAMDIVGQLAGHISIASLKKTLTFQFDSIEDLANAIPAPIMSAEPKVELKSTMATVNWQTDQEANSLVAIAREGEYDNKKEEPYAQVIGLYKDAVKEHQVIVKDLEPDSLYHYQLRSKASIGPEARSRDFTFKTNKQALEITNHTVKNISPIEAMFNWVTNEETDSKVEYAPYRNNVLAVDQTKAKTDKAVTVIHEVKVDDLEAGTVYEIKLSGKDAKGNMIIKIIPTYSTGEDIAAPEIDQVQTSQALSQGKEIKVQTVISWITNEPSTSHVYYQKGFIATSSDLQEKSAPDMNYTKKHGIVITKFEPGAIYTFRVESTDSSGNTAISRLYTALTPKQKESVFQVIMKNFEQMFGWVNNIN